MSSTFTEAAANEKLRLASSIAEAYTNEPGVSAVFLGGSLTAGLGSSTSDVDLFVIVEPEGIEGLSQGDLPQQHLLRDVGVRVDVEALPRGHVSQLVDAVLGRDLSVFALPRLLAGLKDLDVVTRLALSQPVLEGDEYRAARLELANHTDKLRQVHIASWCSAAVQFAEDSEGALTDDDLETAEFASRELLLRAAQAYLAGCGDLYFGLKWVFQKLHRSAGDSFPWAQWRDALQGGLSANPETARDAVFRRHWLAQSLMLAAQLHGWEGEAARWDRWPSEGHGRRRNVNWWSHRGTDTCILDWRSMRTLQVGTAGLQIWSSCTGGDDNEVIAKVRQALPDVTEVATAVPDRLGKLTRAGALWDVGSPGA